MSLLGFGDRAPRRVPRPRAALDLDDTLTRTAAILPRSEPVRPTHRTARRSLTRPGVSEGSYHSRVLSHLSIQCRDSGESAAFYDAVLAPLGGARAMDFGEVIGFGVGGVPSFWIGPLANDVPNREVHIAFDAEDRAAVRAFFNAAVSVGAEILHEPRIWPEYHSNYYGAFVRDPDGNNVEAVCHRPD
jgi:catechol 2,3-dioxygenase-like lactoylglutathione lyase family enzyme